MIENVSGTYIMHCHKCHKKTMIALENLRVSFRSGDEVILSHPCLCGVIEFYGLNETTALLIARFLLKEKRNESV